MGFALAVALPITIPWILLVLGLMLAGIGETGIFLSRRWSGSAAPALLPVVNPLQAPLAVPLIAFCLVSAICGGASGGLKEAIGSLEAVRAFLVYPWAYLVFARHPQLRWRASLLFLVASAVAGLWGTIQQLFNFHPFGYQYLQGTGFLSAPMPFAGEMQLAFGLALSYALARSDLLQTMKPSRRWFWMAILAAIAMGVLFAGERSAWLGAVACGVCVTFFVSPKVFWRAVLIFVVGITVAWFTVPLVRQRLEPLTHWQDDISTRVRLRIWEESYKLFEHSPVFGVGPRKFPKLDIPEAIVPGKSSYLVHGHSNYSHILATTGLVGSLTFAWLSIAMLYHCFARTKSAKGESRIRLGSTEALTALGLFGGVVALMVAGLFEYNFGTGQVRLAQWFLLAMLQSNQSRS